MLDDISNRNLKHLQKHLAAFQEFHPSLSLADVVSLGQYIASRPENLLGTPGGRKVFEEVVTIGAHSVRVRVVLNVSGGLRSIHIRP